MALPHYKNFLCLFINTGADCILAWSACSNPEPVVEQLPVIICYLCFPAAPWKNTLKAPKKLEGTDVRKEACFCLGMILCHLLGWAGLHVSRMPHSAAGAGPGLEPRADLYHNCEMHAVWLRSCLHSETSMANEENVWMANLLQHQ